LRLVPDRLSVVGAAVSRLDVGSGADETVYSTSWKPGGLTEAKRILAAVVGKWTESGRWSRMEPQLKYDLE